MRVDKRLSGECAQQLRQEIASAGGNEVFALGWLDGKGIVCRLRVTACGNEGQVLALGLDGEEYLDAEEESPPDVFIHNHPSGFLTPSDNDLAIAGRAAESGIGAYIVDNAVETLYVVAEPVRRRTVKKIEPEKIIAALSEGGDIARRLPFYEPREAQINLMALVIRAFNEDSLMAAEAGTGVGKSFAYLLPAMHFALLNEERIVISTATITLQQQLFEKDIPLVASGMNKKIKAVLMKGRGNFLCHRRLEEASREPELLEDAEYAELRKITEWAAATKDGGRSDLSFVPAESLWQRICSESDLCMGMRCPYREKCFVLALRKDAADAKIIVVNHHLLFADLAARNEGAGFDSAVVLPPYTRVIIDEAHTIESAATSFFSKEFSRPGVFRQLGRLYRRKRAKQQGLLVRLCSMVSDGERLGVLAQAVEAVRAAVSELDAPALMLCGDEGVFRLAPGRNNGAAAALFPCLAALRKKILALSGSIRGLVEDAPEQGEGETTIWEIKTILRRLDKIAGICAAFPEYRERPNEVLWIERRGGGAGDPWAAFSQTPVELAASLNESLFSPVKTVACVSATLTVNGDFSYWAGRCGLGMNGRPVLSGCFPSPFPYQSAVLLAAPQDAPLPEEAGYQDFVNRAVGLLAAASGGSALVLFTSYQSLQSAWRAALPELQQLGIRCLKQGDDDRSRLLQSFLADESSVLFATDSFWEGVDAPGDTLRQVIICRLPFRTPNDPVFEARREALEKKGGNPFMQLSLPDAVVKFKQGFGRLMRRSSDRGVVAVLDSRLIKKRYGAYFLGSLPETATRFSDLDGILRAVERFL